LHSARENCTLISLIQCEVLSYLPPIHAIPFTLVATRARPPRGEIESGELARSASRFVVNPIDEIQTELSGDDARA
jgi:hypothetical protein